MARFDPITTPSTGCVLTEANQLAALSTLPGPFSLPELAAAICRQLPLRYSTQSGRLAEAALHHWHHRGVVDHAGRRDGLPLYRRLR